MYITIKNESFIMEISAENGLFTIMDLDSMEIASGTFASGITEYANDMDESELPELAIQIVDALYSAEQDGYEFTADILSYIGRETDCSFYGKTTMEINF